MSDLPTSKSATADSSGKAVIRLQPLRAFSKWQISNVGIQSTSSVKVPTFKMYRNSESPSAFMGGTYTGTFNNDPAGFELLTGESLVGVFENCDVGATCTVRLEGTVVRTG